MVLKPYWSTVDGRTVRLYHGDVMEVLRRMPEQSVQTVVTSPPYWGLRDYGTDKSQELGSEKVYDCGGWIRGKNCAEQNWSTGCHTCRMILVFRELKRVLRDDGTLWMNYGDLYSSSGMKLRPGNLVGMPWRVAFALQSDGWILRQDIIWHKPGPCPEPVTNRCTKAHEYLFLFSKKQKYYYDNEAIKEPLKGRPEDIKKNVEYAQKQHKLGNIREDSLGKTYSTNKWSLKVEPYAPTAANKRSVWSINTSGYDGAHFATFPLKLVEPCIKAGTSEKGCCVECGAPWKRIVKQVSGGGYMSPDATQKRRDALGRKGQTAVSGGCITPETKTVGWEPTCDCDTRKTRPCVVLDPFMGSGTTACAALALGRRSWGIDLSEEYLKNHAIVRVTGEILQRPALRSLIPSTVKKLKSGVSLL